MNITDKIDQLNKEYAEQEKIKEAAHARMKEIKAKVGKLMTIAKHAEDVLAEQEKEEAAQS